MHHSSSERLFENGNGGIQSASMAQASQVTLKVRPLPPQSWPLASGKNKQSWVLVRAVRKNLFHNNFCNRQEGQSELTSTSQKWQAGEVLKSGVCWWKGLGRLALLAGACLGEKWPSFILVMGEAGTVVQLWAWHPSTWAGPCPPPGLDQEGELALECLHFQEMVLDGTRFISQRAEKELIITSSLQSRLWEGVGGLSACPQVLAGMNRKFYQ